MMQRLYTICFLLLFVSISGNLFSQVIKVNNVVSAFDNIPDKPTAYKLVNRGHRIPSGGHLQGIQGYNQNGVEHLVISASGNTQSYCITAKFEKGKNLFAVTGVKTLMDKPFRHAGGCQVGNGVVAVGVEDNIAKDKSKILLLPLSGDTLGEMDIITNNRGGAFKRSTAGAVGLTNYHGDHYLVAVGDWDTRNIDFYLSRLRSSTVYDSISTFHVTDDVKWCSYQSINLLSDTTGGLYLVGFCLNGTSNRADLYKLSIEKDHAVLQLIKTRNFACKNGTSFRYGAGIRVISPSQLGIYVSKRSFSSSCKINLFGKL